MTTKENEFVIKTSKKRNLQAQMVSLENSTIALEVLTRAIKKKNGRKEERKELNKGIKMEMGKKA